MCDTYVSDIGYICSECQSEFQEYLEENNLEPKTEGEIKKLLKKFMGTSKGDFVKGEEMSVNEFFTKHS